MNADVTVQRPVLHISDDADHCLAQPFHHRIDPLLGSIENRYARSLIHKALHQCQAEP